MGDPDSLPEWQLPLTFYAAPPPDLPKLGGAPKDGAFLT